MNKYPLDRQGIQSIANDFIQHDLAQEEIIKELATYLREAMTHVEDDDQEWYVQAEKLIQSLHQRKMDFANFRFDQSNGHKTESVSPYSGILDALVPGGMIGVNKEQDFNRLEEGFGDLMTEEELARHFKEPLPKKTKKEKPINKMTLEEIKEWEQKQDNSNDIYKIAARVKNLARQDGLASLTTVGESLCNVYTHVLKSFYDFAEAMENKESKIRLVELTRSQEGMPGNFIMAMHKNVKVKSEE